MNDESNLRKAFKSSKGDWIVQQSSSEDKN